MRTNLRLLRAKHSLTQADLAEKTRVSRQTINSIEAGRYVPSTTLALKIAAVLQTRVEEIFELEDGDWT